MKKRLLVICIVLCIWIGMYAAFPVMAKETSEKSHVLTKAE